MERNGPIKWLESFELSKEDDDEDDTINSKTAGNTDLPNIGSKARVSRRNRYKTNKLRSAPLTVMTESSDGLSRFNINDHYKLADKIGVGTYGEVWLAYDLKTDEKVAIKIAKGSTSISLLQNEAKILESLSSKYFAKFINYKWDHKINRAYLIMEYIPGFTLDKAADNDF